MSEGREVVIVGGVRTPFAKAGTKLKSVHAADLGKAALQELIAQTNLDVTCVDEVIIGNTGSPADAVNISRVIALDAGFPQSISAYTVHRNCASALESVTSAYEKIKSGTMDAIVAGGAESMSQMPLIFSKSFTQKIETLARARTPVQQLSGLMGIVGADFQMLKEMVTTSPMAQGKFKPVISLVQGLTDPFVGLNMGETAEILAKEFHLSREDQDAFALRSHQRATAGKERLAEEITPVYLPPKYEKYLDEDIGPRAQQTLEALAKLKPMFDRKTGTVTAGNACPITDGAVMLLLMEKKKAKEMGYKILATIKGYGFAGLEPERMGLGPAYSSPLALKRAGLTMKDMGVVEINEAFAAQVMACEQAFASKTFAQEKLGLSEAVGEIDPDRLNVNGGAIALGHPVGATGSRLVLTLMKEMNRRSDVQFGLATLCIGGGQGGAIVLERGEA
jgi:acetyl-CoA acyltransferase